MAQYPDIINRVSIAPTTWESLTALIDGLISYSVIPPQTGLAILAYLNSNKDEVDGAFLANTPHAKTAGHLSQQQRQQLAANPTLTQAQWDALSSDKPLTQAQWDGMSAGPVLSQAQRETGRVGGQPGDPAQRTGEAGRVGGQPGDPAQRTGEAGRVGEQGDPAQRAAREANKA